MRINQKAFYNLQNVNLILIVSTFFLIFYKKILQSLMTSISHASVEGFRTCPPLKISITGLDFRTHKSYAGRVDKHLLYI